MATAKIPPPNTIRPKRKPKKSSKSVAVKPTIIDKTPT